MGPMAAECGKGLSALKSHVLFGKAGPVPEVLEPVDYRLLHLRFAGLSDQAIAEDVGRPLVEVRERIRRPRFLQVQAEIEKGLLHRITMQGEYEPVTLAKAAAPEAMPDHPPVGDRARSAHSLARQQDRAAVGWGRASEADRDHHPRPRDRADDGQGT